MTTAFRTLALAAAAARPCSPRPRPSRRRPIPTKPVKIVVPYAPGGPNDILARLLAEKLTQANGQTFIVENKPGGGSNIGAEQVANAPLPTATRC